MTALCSQETQQQPAAEQLCAYQLTNRSSESGRRWLLVVVVRGHPLSWQISKAKAGMVHDKAGTVVLGCLGKFSAWKEEQHLLGQALWALE